MSNRPARNKEVYARAATQLRTHARAFAAEKACPGAMGLYLFCLLQARGEETWGDLPEEVVLSAWGTTRAYRKKQAAALVSVELLSIQDGCYRIVKYDEHNDTPNIIESNRLKERTRKREQREKDVISIYDATPAPPESGAVPVGHPMGLPPGGPISISISDSGLRSRSGEGVGEGPPSWFAASADTAAMAVGGEVGEIPARWASYKSARTRKGWSMNHEDAVGWLCDVVRSERRSNLARPPRSVRPQDIVQPEIEGSWKMPAEMP